MRALDEINHFVVEMEKIGAKDALDRDLSGIKRRHAARGFLRGVRDVVPNTIDGIIGTGLGLVGGLGSFIGGKNFSEGWGQGSGLVKKYMSDPIRDAEMAAGGNAVKRFVDKSIDNAKYKALNRIAEGPGGDVERNMNRFVVGVNNAKAIEDGVAVGTDVLLSWPVYGKAFGLLGKGINGLSSGGRLAKATNVAKSMNPTAPTRWSRFSRSAKNVLGKSQAPAFSGISGYSKYKETSDALNGDYASMMLGLDGHAPVKERNGFDRMLTNARVGFQDLVDPNWRGRASTVDEMRRSPMWSDFA